jgi:predicted dehydrogenase
MSKKVKWGILSTAKIGRETVIPAMQQGALSEVTAIASRDGAKARATAGELKIPKAYGSYEELLADPEVEAIYNPLPNHLHVPWSIRAARAGKHVLCEKPIGLSAAEGQALIAARDETGVKIGEAFMVRTHPQWIRVRELVRSGELGELRSVVCAFSYFKRDFNDIRARSEWGGGGLLDIGCYPVQLSRFVFEEEPVRVTGIVNLDPDMGVDRLTSGILEFPSGHCAFTCGTQMVVNQRIQVICTNGAIELDTPINAPNDRPCRIRINQNRVYRTEEFPICDQYTIQGDCFSRAIREGGEVPTPIEDSVKNMVVIEKLFQSAAAVS